MSMKYPYRDLGVPFDRNFRNDLNANFDDIEHDIRMIGGEAAQQALEAAHEAETQAIYAQTSGDYANDKGDYAAQQGDYAKTQGDYAKAQGDAANLAATNANDAANNANSAATNADNAAVTANNAADNANTAADNANDAATNANTAADNANTQATNAQNAAQSANDAATNANNAADNANTQATYAQQQGDYAKAQGDYAKQVGDENKTRWLNPVATFADIATTYPNPQHGDTVMVTDDGENSGSVYRYENGQWNLTQKHNDLAIADVQNKIGILSNIVVSIESFPVIIPEMDDTARIQRAIDSLPSNGGTIDFEAKTYNISNTVNLRTGVVLRGKGWRSTTIKRTANVIGFKSQGISVLDPSPDHVKNVEFNGICFDGGDFSADFIQFIANSFTTIRNCRFKSTTGRAILGHEWFDSRVENCYFDWIGSSDGTIPGVELKSGTPYEYTNQIHFIGCDFESYRGIAVACTGSNTNEIFFKNCKFESGISNVEHMSFVNSNIIFLDNVTFTSKGSNTSTIPQIVRFENTTKIYVNAFFEHTGTVGMDAASIQNFVKLNNCKMVDFFAFFNANGVDNLTDLYCVKADVWSTSQFNIRGFIDGTNPNGKQVSNIDRYKYDYKTLEIWGNDGNVTFINDSIDKNDKWYIGRVVADGAGTKFRIMRDKGGNTTTPYYINNNSENVFSTYVHLQSGIRFANLSTAPWGGEGSVYADSSNSIVTQRIFLGGAWRRIGYSNAAPTSGTWSVGDIIYNTSPTAGGYVGWVCVSGGTPGTWKTFGAISP